MDFNIPLHLSTTVTRVFGNQRVEGVEVANVDENMRPIKGTERRIDCDALILAVGLIPENEIATSLGVMLDPRTKGPIVDQCLETLESGIYSCGNALHVNDLVDYVSESGEIAGTNSVFTHTDRCLVDIVSGKEFLYNVPQKININADKKDVVMYFRSSNTVSNKTVAVYVDGNCVFRKKFQHLSPPEMQRIVVDFSAVNSQRSNIRLTMED